MYDEIRIEAKNRDEDVARTFSEMAELGYMDTEFTVFGCAYWQEGKRHYLISEQEEKVYRFTQKAIERSWCPTLVMMLTRLLPVPSGQQENIKQDVKKQLARALQAAYPPEFFQKLQQMFQQTGSDGARALLAREADWLEARFDRIGLERFAGLLRQARRSKVLSENSYQEFSAWLLDVAQQMEEDVIFKDIFEKRFYAIGYQEPSGSIKYYLNARWERVYERTLELEAQGCIVTPIFAKDCPYNYTYDINAARNDFKTQFGDIFSPSYLQLVRSLQDLPSEVIMDEKFEADNEQQQQTLAFYKRLWHIV